MPHICIRCGEVYDKVTKELIRRGCLKCGCRLFKWVSEDDEDNPATIVVERDGVYTINIENIDDVVTVYKSGRFFIVLPEQKYGD
ncbi:OapC/ArvC family zinc-ribbon domain-containing protein [Methanopyrus kandleri]